MTVVYPLAAQSDYTELKFSLRSIDKYLAKPFEVILIGEKIPDWINNITWIQLPDIPGKKQLSVRRKILAAFELADEILFMNDDFYLLSHSEIPYYSNGNLKTYPYSGSRQLQERLKELKKPTNHFDLHYPIIFKKDFREIIENFSADCLLRSAYCNWLEIEGITTADRKFLKSTKPEVVRQVLQTPLPFSTGGHSIKSILPILFEYFPHKSNYEL